MKSKLLFIGIPVFGLTLASAFFQKSKAFNAIKTLKTDFAFISEGNCRLGEDSIQLNSFYMQKFEVTNAQYKAFLVDLKTKGDLTNFQLANVDSNAWNIATAMNNKYRDYYFSHPAYVNYPVVNVSYEGAMLYCQWLENKLKASDGKLRSIKVRLPKREEIIRAGRMNTKLPYACGANLSNSRGDVLANFVRLRNEEIHINDSTKRIELKFNDAYARYNFGDILAPSISYYPNLNGIYNLCGNAAEMTFEKGLSAGGSWKNGGYDIRLESTSAYTKANPQTGFRVVIESTLIK
jgi:formylglycine-generating enzyme required for sulfatase activity